MSSAAAEPGEHAVGDAVRRANRRAWLTRLGLVVLSAVVTVAVVRLVGRIDWAAVWDALLHLTVMGVGAVAAWRRGSLGNVASTGQAPIG